MGKKKKKWKDKFKGDWSTGNAREYAVVELLTREGYSPQFIGFGAGSDEYLEGKPDEQAIPDLYLPIVDIYIEVTGSERDFDEWWILNKKWEYQLRHPEQDIWIAYVMGDQTYTYDFIKLDIKKPYNPIHFQTNRGFEAMIVIRDGDDELYSVSEFLNYVQRKKLSTPS